MEKFEKQLIEKLATQVAALTDAVNGLNTKVTELEASDVSIAGLKRSINALAAHVGIVERMTRPAVEERERERVHLVNTLAGDYRVAFTSAELEGKPLAELRKIAATADPDFFCAPPVGALRFVDAKPVKRTARKKSKRK